MNITYKYKVPAISLTDAVATNDANVQTGYAANGPYYHAISGIDAAGAITVMAAGAGVGTNLLSENASFTSEIVTSKWYDIPFKDAVIVANQPHTYKLFLKYLCIDTTNQKINSLDFLNIYNIADGTIWPLTDRFFWKYDFDLSQIFFGFPHADRNSYTNAMGLKLRLDITSKNI